jgi:cysteine dioxygenase
MAIHPAFGNVSRPLDGLIANLRCIPPLERTEAEMAALLSDVCSRGVLLKIPLESRAGSYTRTCAYYDERFEVLLLKWAPGSASQIHDHGGQHCWLAVVDGAFAVENYDRLDDGSRPGRAVIAPRECIVLEGGDLDLRSAAVDIHRVTQNGKTPAVSLHVYARPLQRFCVYDEFAQRCEEVRSRYDALLAPLGAY